MWITRFTRQIEQLAVKSRLVYAAVSLYYREMVRREAELAAIGPEDRVLCIGGGICPYTAILLHELTGAAVTVIDNDRGCVEQCCRFLTRLGLAGIGVHWADGAAVDYRDYTVIHLAMQVCPREEVLSRVLTHAPQGTRVLVRVPKGCVQGLYCPSSSGQLVGESRVQHSVLSNVDYTSILVVPKLPGRLAV
ncbi:MAG TPA: hypothetical protein PLM25_00940 [Limnochordia bacterium]|nr:hypothetical protein [Limnochordia bacterium]